MSTDKQYYDSILANLASFDSYYNSKVARKKRASEHPLDNGIRQKLAGLIVSGKENELFEKLSLVQEIWICLIKKSIVCLRYYDTREPFLQNHSKTPLAYGTDSLLDYFKKYTDFESLLYGGVNHYRDHVVHVFRVWLLGIDILLRNNCQYLDKIKIDQYCQINPLEKLSVWTLISLTHDLGYPLEKSLQIVEKTRDMMKNFVTNPIMNMDIDFSGVQNNMNDFVLRFMSSKMHKKDGGHDLYVARLQPKYYFKFQKSLEHNTHGIISSLILYKLLIFFMESDYSLHEDYTFDKEDVRQYYIRREILRAIASHTCPDVYQLNMCNMSFLLILCDESQDWGRKSLTNLYVDDNVKYTFKDVDIDMSVNPFLCKVQDSYEISGGDTEQSILRILKRFMGQSKTYRILFRDGQDTTKRDFDFHRVVEIEPSNSKRFEVDLKITTNAQAQILATQTRGRYGENDAFNKAFKAVFPGCDIDPDAKTLRATIDSE